MDISGLLVLLLLWRFAEFVIYAVYDEKRLELIDGLLVLVRLHLRFQVLQIASVLLPHRVLVIAVHDMPSLVGGWAVFSIIFRLYFDVADAEGVE